MKDNNYEKRDLLIKFGKEEFKKYGYEKASLRQICKKAGVTTGAVYFFFKNKADLFDAIVRDVAIELQNIIDEQLRNASTGPESDVGVLTRYDHVKYFIDHRDEISILVYGSAGTKYEGYVKRVEDQITNKMLLGIEEVCGKKIIRDIAYVVAKQRIQSYAVLLDRYDDFDDAVEFLKYIRAYGMGGYRYLLYYIVNNE